MKDWLNRVGYEWSRMWVWIVATVVLVAVIWVAAPAQMQVLVYKASLLTFSVALAYWFDRALFRKVLPVDDKMPKDDLVSAARLLARALIFVGVSLGMTLGV